MAQHGLLPLNRSKYLNTDTIACVELQNKNVSNDSVTHTVDGNWLARGHMYVIVNRDMSLSTETCHRQQRHVTVRRVTVVSWHGQPTEFAVHTVRLLQHPGNRMWSGHTTNTDHIRMLLLVGETVCEVYLSGWRAQPLEAVFTTPGVHAFH